jgi:integrase
MRDRLLMCLLIDHGLRVGEVRLLNVENFVLDHSRPYLKFHRPKVSKDQRLKLSTDTIKALRTYTNPDKGGFITGPLIRPLTKAGKFRGRRISLRGLNWVVGQLGKRIMGTQKLSPHDLRHYWATREAESDSPLHSLKESGGWSSPAMPMRYIEDAQFANEGLRGIKFAGDENE